ncbi:MAG: metallophosphoesterase family protein, partial [Sphingomonadales bacterium]
GEISPMQNAYFEKVLRDNPQVKWTFLFMHKPTWKREDGKGMQTIEAALNGRNYTVFNGHLHSFEYNKRLGMDYIMLGTTGGSQRAGDPQAFDHLTFITMDNKGPTITHLKMEGILDKTGHIPADGDLLCYQRTKCGEN